MSKVKRTHFDIMIYVDIEDPGFHLSYTLNKEGNLNLVFHISAAELDFLTQWKMANLKRQRSKRKVVLWLRHSA